MAVDRRRFLELSALGVLAAVAESACTAGNDVVVDRPALIAMLGPDRVKQIGERYRAQTPSENSASALRMEIARRGRFPFPQRDPIANQIERDFEDGRVVIIDGWVLAITEARQAALFSLTRA